MTYLILLLLLLEFTVIFNYFRAYKQLRNELTVQIGQAETEKIFSGTSILFAGALNGPWMPTYALVISGRVTQDKRLSDSIKNRAKLLVKDVVYYFLITFAIILYFLFM